MSCMASMSASSGFGAVGKSGLHTCWTHSGAASAITIRMSVIRHIQKCELQELFAACDIISIHLPVLPATEKLISRDLLYTMKPDAVFVNTARSAVVDMEALQDMAREKTH